MTFGSDYSQYIFTYNQGINSLVDNSIDSTVISDAFIGEWKSQDNSVSVVFTNKTIAYNEEYAESFTIVDEKTISITFFGNTITFKLNDDGTITSSYGSNTTVLAKNTSSSVTE